MKCKVNIGGILILSIFTYLISSLFAVGVAYAWIDNINFTNAYGEYRFGSSTTVCWEGDNNDSYIVGATEIYIDLSYNADFSNSWTNFNPPLPWPGDSTCVVMNGLRQDDNPIYIQVRAYDNAGDSSVNSTEIISRSSSAPASPVLTSPSNGANVDGSRIDFYYDIPDYSNDMQIVVAYDVNFTRIR